MGWQADEVADALDSSVAAVNSALQRARATVSAKTERRGGSAKYRDEDATRTAERYVLAWERGQGLFRVTKVFPPNRHDARISARLVHSAVAEMDRLTPFLGEILQTPKGELLLLKVADLMKREDLPPPVPEAE